MKAVLLARSLRAALSRPFSVHPGSLAAGALLAGVAFLAMSQSSISQAPMPLRVEYMPHPRDVFRIEEGSIYTVPAGKIFVLLGLGTIDFASNGVQFTCNSRLEAFETQSTPYFVARPQGLTYQPGSVLAVSNMSNPYQPTHAYAAGYLVPTL